MTHIWISELSLVQKFAWQQAILILNQYWLNVDWVLANKCQWYLNQNRLFFIQENVFKTVANLCGSCVFEIVFMSYCFNNYLMYRIDFQYRAVNCFVTYSCLTSFLTIGRICYGKHQSALMNDVPVDAQRTHDEMITSLSRMNYVARPFWRYDNISIQYHITNHYLTHCGLMTSYVERDLWQHWLR